MHTVMRISPRETYQLAQGKNGVLLLDVRTPDEFNNELGHAERAMLIPLSELEQRMVELQPFRGSTIIAICRSGNRSGRAAEVLARFGFRAMNMEGGMLQWNKEGLPVLRSGQ